MKVFFTLVPFFFSCIVSFAQSGTTYRLVGSLGSTVTVTNTDPLNATSGFLRPSIWRVVNADGTLGANASPATGARLQIFGIILHVQNVSVNLTSYTFNIQIRSEFRDINAGVPRLHAGRLLVSGSGNNNQRTVALGLNSTVTLGWGRATNAGTTYYSPGYVRLETSGGNANTGAGITALYPDPANPSTNLTRIIAGVSSANTNQNLNANAFNVTATSGTEFNTATSGATDNTTLTIIRTNAAPPSANITNRSVPRNPVPYFSFFPLFYAAGAAPGGAVIPLPMRLGDFTATRQPQGVVLRWNTLQEVNSDNFEIQKSTNAQNWKTIGSIKAAGSSGSVLNYQFEDNSLNSGVVYYRLKMNDLDTKYEYSSVAHIQWGTGEKKLFAYPSPASSFTTISSNEPIDGNVMVLIYQVATGRVVQQKVVTAAGNNFRLGLEGLQSGTYLVQLIKSGEVMGNINIVKL